MWPGPIPNKPRFVGGAHRVIGISENTLCVRVDIMCVSNLVLNIGLKFDFYSGQVG